MIAAAPLLVVLADLLRFVALETTVGPGGKFHVAFYVVVFVFLGFVLSVALTIVGARIAGRTCRQVGLERPTEAGN